jgi:hypothetical protein
VYGLWTLVGYDRDIGAVESKAMLAIQGSCTGFSIRAAAGRQRPTCLSPSCLDAGAAVERICPSTRQRFDRK